MRNTGIRVVMMAALIGLSTAAARADALDAEGRRLAQLVQRVRPHLVAIRFVVIRKSGEKVQRVHGSARGVVADEKGLIVTIGEVYPRTADRVVGTAAVNPPNDISVILRDGTELDADFVGKDFDLNLSFIRVKKPPKDLTPLPVVKKGTLRPGQPVTLVGLMPAQYGAGPWFNQTRIAAAITEPREMYFTSPQAARMLGGPVLNADGKMVGLIAVDSRSVRPENNPEAPMRRSSTAVIVPSWAFAPLIKNPPVVRPAKQDGWLGISMSALDEGLARALGLPIKAGVIVSRVFPGSPAAAGGFEAEDVIVAVDGQPVTVAGEDELPEFRKQVVAAGAGTEMTFTVYRDGKKRDLAVTLAATPQSADEARRAKLDDFGLTVREIVFTDKLVPGRDQSLTGVVAAKVERAGWAGLGGVRPGDIIQKVNDQPVNTLADFAKLILAVRKAKAPEVVFFILRGTETAFIRIQPQWK